MILRYWNYLLIIISVIAIASALIAEYIFNLQPCELCLKQRHPYYLIIFVSLIIFFIPSFQRSILYVLIQLAAIYGIFYSVWHVGVENKLLKGPGGCTVGLSNSLSTADLKEQILSQQVISCDEVVWSFFGISAASLNTMILLFIFVINGLYIYKIYVKQEK
tara:strand:+ start:10023 stop:10508 length:486 start_codon:yes stop_codon:yes gene_type:complete